MKIYKPTLIAPDDPPIVDADVNAAAAIARSKLAAGTADRLVVNAASTGVMADAAAITASRALASDTNGIPVAATPTTTELNYVAGVTSLVQTQLNAITAIPRREVLTAARTYYVRTDGNDSNNGLANTAGGAFLTIQKAVDTCYTIDQNGFDITIQVGAGTYTAATTVDRAFTGVVHILGDVTTPANVLISTTNVMCFNVTGKGAVSIRGFKLQTTTSGNGLYAELGGSITVNGNMTYGAIANGQIVALTGGRISVNNAYSISAGAQYHYLAQYGGTVRCAGMTVTLTGTPAFSQYFAFAYSGLALLYVPGNTFSGAATGQRFRIGQLSFCETAGGGINYFPGNVAGSTEAGNFGLYN